MIHFRYHAETYRLLEICNGRRLYLVVRYLRIPSVSEKSRRGVRRNAIKSGPGRVSHRFILKYSINASRAPSVTFHVGIVSSVGPKESPRGPLFSRLLRLVSKQRKRGKRRKRRC